MSSEFEQSLARWMASVERDMAVMINYMREIGALLGARDRLQTLDAELEAIQRRRTDPAPAMGVEDA